MATVDLSFDRPTEPAPAETAAAPRVWHLPNLREWVLFLACLAFPLDKILALWGSANVEQEGITITRACIVLLAALAAWHAWLARSARLFAVLANPVAIASLAYIVVSCASLMSTTLPDRTFDTVASRLAMVLFYVLIVDTITDRAGLKFVLAAFVLSAIWACSAGAYEMITLKPVIAKSEFGEGQHQRKGLTHEGTGSIRVQGLSSDPDGHGGQLVVQAAMLFFFLFLSRSWTIRGLMFLLLIFIAGNIAATAARGTWLALGVASLTFFCLAPVAHRLLWGIGGLFSIIGGFVILILFFPNVAVLDRILDLGGNGQVSTSFRKEMARVSWEIGRRRPLLGAGTGTFRDEFERSVRVSHYLPKTVIPYPHNAYLGTFAENGAIGLISFLLVDVAVLSQLWWCYWRARDRELLGFTAALVGAYLAFIVLLNFYHFWGSKYGWIIVGLTTALVNVIQAEQCAGGDKTALPERSAGAPSSLSPTGAP